MVVPQTCFAHSAALLHAWSPMQLVLLFYGRPTSVGVILALGAAALRSS